MTRHIPVPSIPLWAFCFLGWAAFLPFASDAQSMVAGEPGRVIIFDASRSMVNGDYKSEPAQRIEQAKLVLTEYLDNLRTRDDRIVTSLVVFGANESYPNSGYSSSRAVPLDHALCRDISRPTAFARMDRSGVDAINAEIRGVSPNGMTPIHLALAAAIRVLDPAQGGELVLISDLDEPNCLPAGQDICEAIEPELATVRQAGGVVRALIFETPNVQLKEILSRCMPTQSFTLATQSPDIEDLVESAFDQSVVTPELVVDGANPADQAMGDPATMQIWAIDMKSNQAVSLAPFGPISVPEGTYQFELRTAAGQWKSGVVSIRGATNATIHIPAATLTVTATDNAGSPITSLASLTYGRAGAAALAATAGPLPARIAVANGGYIVTGTLPDGRTATALASVDIGQSTAVVLNFGAMAVAARPVTVNLNLQSPSLNATYMRWPDISLIDPSGPRTALRNGATTLSLLPGTYSVEIESTPPQLLSLDVAAGTDPFSVTITVPPGWFSATSSLGRGDFQLIDATGTPIYQFLDTDQVENSLPDGDYELVFRRGDGVERRQAFSVKLGERTEVGGF